MDIRWLSLFADVPADRTDAARAFWTAVTGATSGSPSGEHGEYLPLVPADGDRFLWLQRIGSDTPGWHPDLHVPDVSVAATAAVEAGARIVRHADGLTTAHTPGGQPFCLVEENARRERHRPAPTVAATGRSLVDQLCLNIPHRRFEAECAFWAGLTGWPRGGVSGEFDRLAVPAELPVRFLLQRLGPDDRGPARAHADLAAEDRPAEVARHAGLGADVVRVAEHWTTLRDPAGLVYCVTDRQPHAA